MEEIKSEETQLSCKSCKNKVKIYPTMYCHCGVAITGDMKEEIKTDKNFLYFPNHEKAECSI